MRLNAVVANSIPVLAFTFACTCNAQEPIKLDFAWKLSLDAQGHVAQLTAIANRRADAVPQIRERLEQAIRTWNFVSGTVNGRPAPTDTHLSVSISLLPNEKNSYRITFDDARTGGRILKAAPPHYPVSAVRGHKTGMVVLRVQYDAGGRTVAATLDPDSPQSDKSLVDASIEAVQKSWTFQPELVDGQGVPGTQVLPICYALTDVAALHASDPERECLWNPPGRHATIGQGESLAVDPVARLTNDVAGRAL